MRMILRTAIRRFNFNWQGLDVRQGMPDKLPDAVLTPTVQLLAAEGALICSRDGRRHAKFTNDDPDNSYTYADVRTLVDSA